MNKSPLLILVFAAGCATTAATEKPAEQPAPAAAPVTAPAAAAPGASAFITGAQARELVAKGAVLIDVRTPEEFAANHVAGAKNVPVQELPARLADIGPKDTPVVVYCKSGKRSSKAAEILRAEGYTVYNLGSFENW
jgi:rhodanese-related sulfurtransferase